MKGKEDNDLKDSVFVIIRCSEIFDRDLLPQNYTKRNITEEIGIGFALEIASQTLDFYIYRNKRGLMVPTSAISISQSRIS